MKTLKKTAAVLGMLFLVSVQGFSSFYASGTFIVRIKKIHGRPVADKFGRLHQKATFRVLRHTNGQGHIMNLYKNYVGQTFTRHIIFKKGAAAPVVRGRVRVIYRYISGYSRDPKTGKRRIHSSRSWKLLGRI